MMRHPGELAALGALLCWTGTTLAFATAARRLGASTANLLRLLLALVLFAVYGRIARGLWWPSDASGHAWLWLSLSGLSGYVIADLCSFRSFVLWGARMTALLFTTVAPLSALIGWWALGEQPHGGFWLGMGVTLVGICLVLSEPHHDGSDRAPAKIRLRVLLPLAVGIGLGQAAGFVMSKHGMRGYDAFASTQIRAITACAVIVLLHTRRREWKRSLAAVRDVRGVACVATGAFLGPFLGMTLCLISLRHIPAGLSATITALTPVLIIPPSLVLHKEKVGWRGVTGACVAVTGVAIACLS